MAPHPSGQIESCPRRYGYGRKKDSVPPLIRQPENQTFLVSFSIFCRKTRPLTAAQYLFVQECVSNLTSTRRVDCSVYAAPGAMRFVPRPLFLLASLKMLKIFSNCTLPEQINLPQLTSLHLTDVKFPLQLNEVFGGGRFPRINEIYLDRCRARGSLTISNRTLQSLTLMDLRSVNQPLIIHLASATLTSLKYDISPNWSLNLMLVNSVQNLVVKVPSFEHLYADKAFHDVGFICKEALLLNRVKIWHSVTETDTEREVEFQKRICQIDLANRDATIFLSSTEND